MKYLPIGTWAKAAHRIPCLDIRDEAAFARAHVAGAGNIPLEQVEDRIHELPRKGGELFVVGGDGTEAAARLLDGRSRWVIAWSDETLADLPAELLSQAPAAPLWRPNEWLSEYWRHIPEGGRVFDAAMGSGRNAVFLALRGYRVTGEDILPEALDFARALAERHGVRIETRLGDLRRDDPLEPARWDGITVFNYLDRDLLPHLKRALAPGGVLIYETFTEAQGRLVGRPSNPQWLLRPRELLEAFEDLEVIAYREGSAERDRHVASIVARR